MRKIGLVRALMGLPGGLCQRSSTSQAPSRDAGRGIAFASGVYDPTFPKGTSQKEKEALHLQQAMRTAVFTSVIMQKPTFSFCSLARGAAALNLAPSAKLVLLRELRLSAHGWVIPHPTRGHRGTRVTTNQSLWKGASATSCT